MADRVNESVIAKLRKILSKTEEAGCTEAEAQSAYAMASRLMAEHNLSMADMAQTDAGATQEEWAEEAAWSGGKWTIQCGLAWDVVHEFFFVEGITHTKISFGKRVKVTTFFGRASNVEAATWTFKALLGAFDRLFEDYRRRTGCAASERRLFTLGVSRGFKAKLKDEQRAMEIERDALQSSRSLAVNGNPAPAHAVKSTALALKDIRQETEEEYKRRNPKIKKAQSNYADYRGSRSSLDAGFQAGRNLNLNRAVGQESRKGLPGS
jgi:hypothetical protein